MRPRRISAPPSLSGTPDPLPPSSPVELDREDERDAQRREAVFVVTVMVLIAVAVVGGVVAVVSRVLGI